MLIRTKVIKQRMIKKILIRSIRNKSLTVCGTATVDVDVHSINPVASAEKGRLVLPIPYKKLSRFTISECRYRSEGGSLVHVQ